MLHPTIFAHKQLKIAKNLKGEFVVTGFNRKVIKALGGEKGLSAYN